MGLLSRWLGTVDGARDVVGALLDAYRAEAEHAARLRQHATHARYPQVADALRQLAMTEERHAGWLRDRILELGGGVPPVAPLPPVARNQWERAVAARHEAQQKRRRLVELAARLDPERPAEVALLQRIEHEDTGVLETYEHLVMRSDPHALD
jgi:rubrerythrin